MNQFIFRLLDDIEGLKPEHLQKIEDHFAGLSVGETALLASAIGRLYGRTLRGLTRAENPEAALDAYGRPVKCSCCGTTEGLHADGGSGGPYRCGSRDCVVF